MNRHLSFRSGNPVLSNKTFIASSDISNRMTMNGTVNKTLLSLFLLMVSGYYMFSEPNIAIMAFSGIGALIFAIVTIFKKTWAPITVPIYAALEGLLLGGISTMFEQLYPGIVSQAIFITFGILASLLIAYKSGFIKPTENFKLGVAAATGGIAFIYMISWIMSFWGSRIPLIHSSSTLHIFKYVCYYIYSPAIPKGFISLSI